MKKIILLGNVPSSFLTFRQELIKDLVKRDYKVYCAAYSFDDTSRKIIESWGAITFNHDLNPKGLNPIQDTKAVFKLFNIFKNIQPDIVFPFFVKPVIFGSIAAKFAKIPKIVGMIEGLGNGFTPHKKRCSFKAQMVKYLQIILYKISAPIFNNLIVLNPDDKTDLFDKYNIKVKKLHVLGGIGVDLSKFQYSVPDIDKPITFIFIARLLEEKGIFDFINAAHKVKQKYPNTIFNVIGGLDEKNPFALNPYQLKEYIDSGLIEYPGHVDNVSEWIKNSHIFVLPSFYREGVPRSTQEAMAIGRPIITTNLPGCKETVIDSYNGFFVQHWNVDDLVQKMYFFIENKNQIIIMGEKSRKLAEEKFDIFKINSKIINIVES